MCSRQASKRCCVGVLKWASRVSFPDCPAPWNSSLSRPIRRISFVCWVRSENALFTFLKKTIEKDTVIKDYRFACVKIHEKKMLGLKSIFWICFFFWNYPFSEDNSLHVVLASTLSRLSSTSFIRLMGPFRSVFMRCSKFSWRFKIINFSDPRVPNSVVIPGRVGAIAWTNPLAETISHTTR